MVGQLLREFVDGPWLDDLDLDGMERLNARFQAGTSERRGGDMVWRIPRRSGGDTYLVLPLEFQSTPDRWMALRMRTTWLARSTEATSSVVASLIRRPHAYMTARHVLWTGLRIPLSRWRT